MSADRTAWAINLVQVPSFNLTGLNLKCPDSWSTFDARFIAPGSTQRAFVLKVLRALKEVGAFYVNGHSLSSDLFQLCQAAYGNQPFQDDASTGSDASYKNKSSPI